MKTIMKRALKFTLILLPIGLIAGLFVGIYTYGSYTDDVKQLIISQMGSYNIFLMVTTVQYALYAVICGFFGYILSYKIGLMKSFSIDKKKLYATLGITIIIGILFSLDYWIFGGSIPQLKDTFPLLTTPISFGVSILYGGIIEEVLMRLFLMSLIAFIIWKVFLHKTKQENIPTVVFILANIISALLFAVGHLPATVSTFGAITPLLLVRCFLYNGGLGLAFGWLYRRYGIGYAMVSHAGVHIISKVIWLLFI